MLRFKIILYFIYFCFLNWVWPWRFSQLNKKYFNTKRSIFSKYEIEKNIPNKWKLNSIFLNSKDSLEEQKNTILSNFSFPIFLKPEWWQNSHWIFLVKKEYQIEEFLKKIRESSINYLIQQWSLLNNEYEILYTKNNDEIFLHSITESLNNNSKLCISWIHNNTKYKDLINKFNLKEKNIIKKFIYKVWDFNVGRIWIKANNVEDIIKWKFKIFEINIFLPMMLSILDNNTDKNKKTKNLKKYIKSLIFILKNLPIKWDKSIFFRQMLKHYTLKINNNKIYITFKKIIYKIIEKFFLNWCSNYNSLDIRKSCKSKKQARDMFEKNNIPYAKWEVFFNPYYAYKFIKKYWFPIVLKPNIWWFSRWSYFPIINYIELFKAIFFVKLWWPFTVIEQYLLWKNYRVIVTKNKIDLIIKRYPPFIIWDWNSNISNLINIENKKRLEMKLFPIISKIKKNFKIKIFLKKQWLNLKSIIAKNKKIFLYNKVSLELWWVIETIDIKNITQKNKKIILKILNLFNANIFWIDIIMEKWINIDFDKQKTIFLEVNSRPFLKMHEFPRYWKKPDMKKLYKKLDSIYIENKSIF